MTARDTPSDASDALQYILSAAVKRQLEARNDLIEAACVRAHAAGVGVRVKTYSDGRTTAAADHTVPALTIYEEHPDQPNYGIRFEED